MSASATSSRGVRKAPPEYVHPPPPVRPYTNVHQGDGRPLGDIQLEERVRRGDGARVDERPDLNSFTTKKSVSAGKKSIICCTGYFVTTGALSLGLFSSNLDQVTPFKCEDIF